MSDTVIETRRRKITLAGVEYTLLPMPLEAFGDVSRALGDVLRDMITEAGNVNLAQVLAHGDELRTALKAGVRVEGDNGDALRLAPRIIDGLGTGDALNLAAAFITHNEDFFILLLRPTAMAAPQEGSQQDGTMPSPPSSATAN